MTIRVGLMGIVLLEFMVIYWLMVLISYDGTCPLVICYIAIEAIAIWFDDLPYVNMVIFNNHVKLPEGVVSR